MNAPWELIDAFLDDELTPGQEAELRDWLIADREHVRVFMRASHLHRSLRTEMLAQKVLPGEGALNRTTGEEFDKEPGGVGNLSPSPSTGVDIPTVPRRVLPFPQSHCGRFIRPRGAISALAASIALLIGLSVWFFPSTNNEPTLTVALGTRATLERNGQSFPAQDGLKLLPGDLLRISGSNGAAIGYDNENTRFALNDDTELKTLAWRKGKRFELRQGKLEAVVARQRPFGPMVLVTMQAEARVLGTKFTLTTTTNATRLDVSEGRVRLTRATDGARVDVPQGRYTIAATGVELAALPQTGRILHEYWTNFPGKAVNDLLDHPDYPDRPSGRDYVDLLEVPALGATNYACRLVGYLHPPVTGQYIFWIAASPAAAVNLSRDENPANAIRIFGDNYDFGRGRESQPREWERKATASRTQSQLITLVAGRRYYIEAVHKADDRGGHLAVAWTPPGGEREIIAGKYLSPLKQKK